MACGFQWEGQTGRAARESSLLIALEKKLGPASTLSAEKPRKPRKRGFAVQLPIRRFEFARKFVAILSMLMAFLWLFIFVLAFDRVDGPHLDKTLAVPAAQSLVTASGILAAATVALVSFHLGRFFESVEPFMEKVEPAITRRFYESLNADQKNRVRSMIESDEWPLEDPELGPPSCLRSISHSSVHVQ